MFLPLGLKIGIVFFFGYFALKNGEISVVSSENALEKFAYFEWTLPG